MIYKIIYFLISISILNVSFATEEKLPVITGYFAEWGIYERNYQVADIPADKITHVIYAFAKIENGEVALGDIYAATEKAFPGDSWDEELRGNFKQLQILKKKHPHLKTLIAVGGWTLSEPFSDMALTEASREKFAISAAKFVEKYGFDGIDIDWEYPCGGGLAKGRPVDKQNFTLLMAELRNQLHLLGERTGKEYLLTVASPAGIQMQHYELGEVAKYIDWYNLMAYDFHGSWEKTTNHQSALFPSSMDRSEVRERYNASYAVCQYVAAGVSPDQIVLGIPFYSRGWSGVSGENAGFCQSSSHPSKGTWETGILDYSSILRSVQQNPESYLLYWDDEAKVSWIYNPYLDGGSFFTFEDVKTVREKVRFIKEMQLRGVMFWEFSGDIRDSNDPDSLINALKNP